MQPRSKISGQISVFYSIISTGIFLVDGIAGEIVIPGRSISSFITNTLSS